MSDAIIRVENLSKKYVISHQQRGNNETLRDTIANTAKSLTKSFRLNGKAKHQLDNPAREEFWALRDVSFEINRGDRVGIIGRNGAGKSTLLKVLSRITEPTKGKVRINGRVASLLEVGTGFHPELTGRENIFLNGAILGMSKEEIKRKFDEIVAFAEVEKFLDTPVKRYSSGMYVRLAFAVAAHLEPEILVVDEVLAVGDTQFQQKCMGKMKDVGKDGRTVIFVSHNMGAVSSLCNQGIFLKSGRTEYAGHIEDAIRNYTLAFQDNSSFEPGILYQKSISNLDSNKFQILEVSLLDESGSLKPIIKTWDYCRIRIRFYAPRHETRGAVEFAISTYSGSTLIQYSTSPLSGLQLSFTEGESYVDCVIPKLPLGAGSYQFSVGLAIPKVQWLCWEENIASLDIIESDVYHSQCPPDQKRTPVVIEHSWDISGKTISRKQLFQNLEN